MNYTEKYHLPQWVKEDRVMMDDFNQMCADMEAGLNQNAQAAADALAAANSKPTSAAVSQAQSTANQALSAAHAAQATANAAYSPSFKTYATGTYAGKGHEKVNEVTVGFKPVLLLITGQMPSANTNTNFSAILGEDTLSQVVTFTSTGFIIQAQIYGGMSIDTKLWINERDHTYRYFAFR